MKGYNVYEFNVDPRNVYVIGDTHGNWGLLRYKITELDVNNCILIIAGDCGFGFEKKEYYRLEYNRMKKILKNKNITIVFVRGNHDNPIYFDGKMINFNYWKAIPDYSVISLSGGAFTHNILCVGGAISIDRRLRIARDNIIRMRYKSRKSTYWVNEEPIYRPDILDEIKSDGISINTLVTHSSPDFAPLFDKTNIQSFIDNDEHLADDISNERLVMTNIYRHLVIKDKHPLKLYVYGHFHQHIISLSPDDVKLVLLDCINNHNNSWDIYPVER